MYDAGFRFVSFGVESANEHIYKLSKRERLERIEQAIKDACAIGYDVTLFFILGLPERAARGKKFAAICAEISGVRCQFYI